MSVLPWTTLRPRYHLRSCTCRFTSTACALFSLLRRSHAISFTRAHVVPKCKIGLGRGKGWESWGKIGFLATCCMLCCYFLVALQSHVAHGVSLPPQPGVASSFATVVLSVVKGLRKASVKKQPSGACSAVATAAVVVVWAGMRVLGVRSPLPQYRLAPLSRTCLRLCRFGHPRLSPVRCVLRSSAVEQPWQHCFHRQQRQRRHSEGVDRVR
jgi:hypothetical protein